VHQAVIDGRGHFVDHIVYRASLVNERSVTILPKATRNSPNDSFVHSAQAETCLEHS
jgi:hypothetical protein